MNLYELKISLQNIKLTQFENTTALFISSVYTIFKGTHL
jgi:hypothetical protein